jgi:1-deoxy-D-xylulose-5-phosphate reductoisomerase
MELPVLYALTHPERIDDNGVQRFDPVAASALTFEPVRHDAFPALRLGVQAGRRGGAAPAVFNAANEQAVEQFLCGRATFQDIPRAIEAALAAHGDAPGRTRDDLLSADADARRLVLEMLPC